MANTPKKVTIKDIARIAEVSPTTVSLVLNNKKGVGKETRYRILRVASELKYTPNLMARSLAKSHSDIIALTILQARNALFMEIADGAAEAFNENGYSIMMASTYDDPDLETKELASARARGVDGFLITSAQVESPGIWELVEDGVPLVSVLRRVPGLSNLNYIMEDSFKGGYLAAEHLIKLGHKRIGIVKGTPNTTTGIGRFEGAVAAMKDNRVPVDDKLIAPGEFARGAAYLATLAMLHLPDKERPTAIYACNDDMAMGVYEATLDTGLRVPEDMALVGFNNAPYTSLPTVALTTIDVQAHEMGRLGAERLIDIINKKRGHTKPLQVIMEPKLIVRNSCGARKEDEPAS
ncbi:MAG: LacI family transcriptional regulator [Desulfarculaceae bacterium]|nr:LacI family transcriptional regulator [Desulfarculaceae bacterium]MCF8074433.1 LacI family transcriptional regulator [Desulfarculaceae bacterium]MCF8102727.1 LacI family transcriptional regulator [Desulfarculaceae bacterium]MCF8116418.1 LacI family transcriptional regulator [Desulfarculaceae bacterium]